MATVFSTASKGSASSAMLLLLATENTEVRETGSYPILQKIDLVRNFKMGILLLPLKGVRMSQLKSESVYGKTRRHVTEARTLPLRDVKYKVTFYGYYFAITKVVFVIEQQASVGLTNWPKWGRVILCQNILYLRLT